MFIHWTCATLILCTFIKYYFTFPGCWTWTFYPSEMLRGCLVCLIWNSSSFHFFIFKLCTLWLFAHWTCAPYILCTFDNIFWSVELKHYYVNTTFGVLTLCNLFVICNSNRSHSFIFKLCIMIVHTLKMCTGNTGPEQRLVLVPVILKSPGWILKLIRTHVHLNETTCQTKICFKVLDNTVKPV